MATILITDTDLELAVRLRAAFSADDRVEFVTSSSDARSHPAGITTGDAALIFTGTTPDQLARDAGVAGPDDDTGIAVVAVFNEEIAVPEGWAVELGIDDYFVQPVDPDEVALVVRRLAARKQIQREIGIVGRSEAIQEVVERIAQIAPVGSTVLITGESGTGKELAARGLHKLSPRRGKPFIAVNIAALPETLLESELFGHEKGAFTGANSLRKGMFELAQAGTIFLDEVAEMSPGPQTRLLRVLEQREFMRVGGAESIRVDVRVIAATNRDLRRAFELTEFRRDLYFRLNVLSIHMPALRERSEDIPLLVREFIREFGRDHDRQFRGITPEAMRILQEYDWPGNVRELRNLVESMVVLAPGSLIGPEDIPPEVRGRTGRALLPRPFTAAVPQVETRTGARLPEMEFIFRTLVELKVDVEDLRRDFEAYKRQHPELLRPSKPAVLASRPSHREEPTSTLTPAPTPGPTPAPTPGPTPAPTSTQPRDILSISDQPPGAVEDGETQPEDAFIRFRPGATLEELERAAIIATLKEVGGNRRRASEKLGIGERTLYRKLKEYRIDD